MEGMKPQLVDMKLPEKQQGSNEMAVHGEMEEFPYGLCIHLEKEQIDALNLSEIPEPGDAYKVLATGVVTQSAMNPGGKDPRVSIQLTAIQLIPEKGEMEDGEESDKPSGNGSRPKTILGNSYRSYD